MRDKVLRVIERYAEGGTIRAAIAAEGLKTLDFYRFKAKDPELEEFYEQVQRFRADMGTDEAYEISTGDIPDPRVADVRAKIRLAIAKMYDRRRFGDKIDLVHTVVDLSAALSDAAARARLQPPCDPTQIVDAEYVALPPAIAIKPTDKQSDEAPAADHSRFFDE